MNNKNTLTGVLLAAGKGLRAYPSTKFIPKPLLKVSGETLLSYNLKILINTFKVKEIFIVVGHLDKQVIEYIKNKSKNAEGCLIIFTENEMKNTKMKNRGVGCAGDNLLIPR